MKRAALVLLLVIASGTATSGATYTASSDNPQGFTAALDFGLDVTASVAAGPLSGTVNLSATATETNGGTIDEVVIQRSPAGAGTWTTICTLTAPPYSCPLNTTTLGNGRYDFRATATNDNGYTKVSATVGDRLVDNAGPSITIADPGAWFRGTLTLSTATLSDNAGGSGVNSVRYEYKTSAGSTWSTACTASAPTFSCPFATGALTTGTYYDFRAVATDVAGNPTTSASVINRRPDHVAPNIATITAPATNLGGTVTLLGTAGDGHSGVASATMQYSVAGANSWSVACTDATAPFSSCSWDTTAVPSNLYDLRTVVTDVAGNTRTSTALTNHRVDNTAPSTSLVDPGGLAGTEVLTATAIDNALGSGVKNVQIQWSPAGAGTWTTLCTDTTSTPYSCSWDTTAVPDGSYDLRSVATDNLDNAAPSAVLTRSVDNPPRAVDVQTTNAGTAGLMQSGDTITFTYSTPMTPSSILAGWDGTGSPTVRVRVVNVGQNDLLTVESAGGTLLGLTATAGVKLGANHMSGPDILFAATMTRSGSSFTVALGTQTSGQAPTVGVAASMTWNPSAAATDVGGEACLTTPALESGTAAPNF